MPDLPETMTAVAIRIPGGPEVLTPETRPLPVPATSEILVRVRAAGVNRPDAMQRRGQYPPPPGASDLPGLEVAGEVAALGAGAAGSASATRSPRWCRAAAMRNIARSTRSTRCRCRAGFG